MNNKDYVNINLLMNKSFSAVSFLAIPIAIGLLCITPTFVPLFFGEKFMGAVVPLMILSLLIIVIGLNNLTGVQMLIGMGLDKLFFYSVLTGTITNFVMNCLFIPLWGAIGASVASVIAETLILLVTIYFVYNRTQIRINSCFDIIKAFIGAIFFIPLIILLRRFLDGWWLIAVFVVLGGVSYIVVEFLLQNKSIDLFKDIITNTLKNHFKKV
jgi:O-antigen/teichoic acid export membrane protein